MKSFILNITLLIVTFPILGQEQISGIVVDTEDSPVEFAQVVALSEDSTIINSSQTNENGIFTLKNDGVAILNISAFGFEQQSIRVAGKCGDLGTIKLSDATINLKEVIVTASVPVIKLQGRAIVTNVANSYLSQLGTANDVLSWIPMVTSKDGDFSVFGKGTPLIYINGRKITNKSELELLSSGDIKDIKLITNPGAKYDASVKSVIQIQTKRVKGDGFGINVRTKGSFANDFSALGQVDLSYRTGGLDLGLVSYAEGNKKRYETKFIQETYLSSLIQESLLQKSTNNQKEYIEKFIVNYTINNKHSIGGNYRLSLSDNQIKTANNSEVLRDGILRDEVSALGLSKNKLSATHTSNIYYSGTMGNWELNFNLDYLSSNPKTSSSTQEISINFGKRDVNSFAERNTRFFAHKATASYNFNKARIELGEEYTNSKMEMEYYNFENIVPNSNNKVKEYNQAVFLEYSQMIGQHIQFDAGFRYEHISHHYISKSDKDTHKTYNNIFPSVGLSAQFDNLSLSLSYSNKAQRPSYSQLDDNLHYDNRYQYQKGNPELRSVRMETYEFMANLQPFFIQLSYQRQRHPILYNAEPYSNDPDVNIISYINGPTIKEIDAMAGVEFGDKHWNLQVSGGVAKQYFNTLFKSQTISMKSPIGLLKLDGYVKLPFDIKLMCDFTHQTGGNLQNSHIGPHTILNVALYKTFCKGKLDIRISGQDLLNKNYDQVRLYSGNTFINTTEKFDTRSCQITFRYHLNVSKSKYKGTGAGQTEKERL